MNKKVFLFDLDDTLYLYSTKDNSIYHKKIKNFLYSLKKKDKILGLITYNANPKRILSDMGIDHNIFDIFEHSKNIPKELFDKNYSNYQNYKQFISRCDSERNRLVTLIEYKKDMILRNIQNYDKKDIIFFDDNLSNILQCRTIGIECIKVDPERGIEIERIMKKI